VIHSCKTSDQRSGKISSSAFFGHSRQEPDINEANKGNAVRRTIFTIALFLTSQAFAMGPVVRLPQYNTLARYADQEIEELDLPCDNVTTGNISPKENDSMTYLVTLNCEGRSTRFAIGITLYGQPCSFEQVF